MKIFSWGPNNKGQRGSGDYEDCFSPNCITIPLDACEIKSIMCGLTFSFIITKSGLVYACGNNFKGEISLNEIDNITNFVLLKSVFNIRVATIAAGWDFSIILTENGCVYSSGDNRYCQLGLDNEAVTGVSQFTQINLPTMKSVKAGIWHVIALTDDNKIWTWGYNHKAQVGLWPRSRESILPCCRNMNCEQEDISFIIAGAYHSGYITKSDNLIMWGDNLYGQCGYNDNDDRNLVQCPPRRMESSLEKIDQLECGWTHCVARDIHGVCYSWGQNRYSQLGRTIDGNVDFDPIPKPVNYFIENCVVIREISCGSQHSLALDSNGAMWSWGWNDHGILGIGDLKDRMVPEKVSSLSPEVLLVSKGGAQSFAVVL